MIVRGKWLLWLQALRHSAVIAGFILIAAAWFVAAYISSIEREKAVKEAMKQSDGLVRLFEHSTAGILSRFDRTLLLLRKSYEDDPVHFDLRKWAGQTSLISEGTFQLSLIGSDGYLKATTLDFNGPPVYLGDRSYIQEQMRSKEDRLIISQPVMGRTTGLMSLQLVRRLRNADGSSSGVMVLSVDPNFIEPFYRTVDLGKHGSLLIRNFDNIIIAAQGFPENVIGHKVGWQAIPIIVLAIPAGALADDGRPEFGLAF